MPLAPGPPDWPTAPPVEPPTSAASHPPSVTATTTALTPPGAPHPSDPRRREAESSRTPRDLAGASLLVFGAVLLALGNLVAWADAVANEPATYEDARILDLEDGGLETLIRARLTTVIVDWADIEGRVGEVLPAPFDLIGGPTEELARRALDETIAATLTQEPLAGTIDRIETIADEELMNLLLAESDWFRLDGSALVLDLDPLVRDAAQRFDELVPDMLSEAIPALSASTLLPDDIEDGGVELVIGDVPALAEARGELDDLARAARPLALAGAVLVLLGLAISARRARALVIAGISLAGVAVVLAVATGTAGAPPLPSTDALRAIAGHSFYDLDADGLLLRSSLAVAAGLTIAAVGAALGRSGAPGPRLPSAT